MKNPSKSSLCLHWLMMCPGLSTMIELGPMRLGATSITAEISPCLQTASSMLSSREGKLTEGMSDNERKTLIISVLDTGGVVGGILIGNTFEAKDCVG